MKNSNEDKAVNQGIDARLVEWFDEPATAPLTTEEKWQQDVEHMVDQDVRRLWGEDAF